MGMKYYKYFITNILCAERNILGIHKSFLLKSKDCDFIGIVIVVGVIIIHGIIM